MFPKEYEKAKWTLIRALVFLLSVIVAAIAGLVIVITMSFPFMLIGVFYLLVGTVCSILTSIILWSDFQKFRVVREVLLKYQKVAKTTS